MKKFTLGLLAAILAITMFGLAPAKASARDGFSTADETQIVERRKKRVKGGSGCDDPGDVAEHPECR